VKAEHLLYLVIGGVILADLVSHAAGTSSLFKGANILFAIGTRPTDTKAIKTSTSVTNNTSTGTTKV
jgi:hypothetical protein